MGEKLTKKQKEEITFLLGVISGRIKPPFTCSLRIFRNKNIATYLLDKYKLCSFTRNQTSHFDQEVLSCNLQTYVFNLNQKILDMIPPDAPNTSIGAIETALNGDHILRIKTIYSSRFGKISMANLVTADSIHMSSVVGLEKLESVKTLYGTSAVRSLPSLKVVYGGIKVKRLKKLPSLEFVGGDLQAIELKEALSLKEIGGNLFVNNSIKVPKLFKIGRNIYISSKKVFEFPALETVGGAIVVPKENLKYWEDYFMNTKRIHLMQKVRC